MMRLIQLSVVTYELMNSVAFNKVIYCCNEPEQITLRLGYKNA